MRTALLSLLGCAVLSCGGKGSAEGPPNDAATPAVDASHPNDVIDASETNDVVDASEPNDAVSIDDVAADEVRVRDAAVCIDRRGENDASPPNDAGSTRDVAADAADAAVCPKPVDCTGGSEPHCRWPHPVVCQPIDEQFYARYCDNGYTIVEHSYEGGNIGIEYFLDSKLVATFGGYRTASCSSGPPDFVEPTCDVYCLVNLCP